MTYFMYILLGFLVVCAVAVSFSKNLLNSILIFMSYSLIMSIIWILLESPDLAITEAAVGAGVTTVLFLVTLKKLHTMQEEYEETLEDREREKQDAIAAGFKESDKEYTAPRRSTRIEIPGLEKPGQEEK